MHDLKKTRNQEESKKLEVDVCKFELQNDITEITKLRLELSTSEGPGPKGISTNKNWWWSAEFLLVASDDYSGRKQTQTIVSELPLRRRQNSKIKVPVRSKELNQLIVGYQ